MANENLEQIVEQALSLPGDERSEYLSQACEGDENLRDRVEELLDHHDSADPGFKKGRIKIPNTTISEEPKGSRSHPIAIGQVLSSGRYQIEKRLGVGGMATVFLAYDRNLNVPVAVKFPDQNLLNKAAFRRRFLQETHSLVNLRHPNILKIIDVGEHDGTPYAVMDYLAGGSINDQRRRDPQGNHIPVVPAFFDKWLNRIADALDFIHRRGYVHRDIKPDNILFDEHGNAFLSDFGIAKIYEETKEPSQDNLTQAGMLVGTPEYMAPEILLGQKYDGRSDQYSLAVVVYELLVGSRPFVGSTPAALVMKQAKKEFNRLKDLKRDWDAPVTDVLTRALETDPRARFTSCTEFEGALARAFAETPHREINKPVLSRCPACAAPMVLQPQWFGKLARCKKCSERMRIQPNGMVFPASAAVRDQRPSSGSTVHQEDRPLCLNCGALLRIPTSLRGKKVKCLGCKTVLCVSEDGSRCISLSAGPSETANVKNGPLASFVDTVPHESAPSDSAHSRPARTSAQANAQASRLRSILLMVLLMVAATAASVGVGIWIVLNRTNSRQRTADAKPTISVPSPTASAPQEPPSSTIQRVEESSAPNVAGARSKDDIQDSLSSNDAGQKKRKKQGNRIGRKAQQPSGDSQKPKEEEASGSKPSLTDKGPKKTLAANTVSTSLTGRDPGPPPKADVTPPPSPAEMPPVEMVETIISTADGNGADAMVDKTKNEPLGKKTAIGVQMRRGVETVHSYLRFDLSEIADVISYVNEAELILTVVGNRRPVGATVRVVGVDVEMVWPESGIKGIQWNTSYSAAGFESLPLLAEIKVTAEGDPRDSGKNQVRISGPKLAQFIAASPRNRVTLALAGSGIENDALLFVSREKTADLAPKLVVKAPKEAPPQQEDSKPKR